MEFQQQFTHISDLIADAKRRAFQAVNKELVMLYWQIGEYVSQQVAAKTWGDGTVQALAEYINRQDPTLKGFTKRGLYRMRQFYETYADTASLSATVQEVILKMLNQLKVADNQSEKFVSALLTQITWTHHLEILSGCKSLEERYFYIVLTIKERYTTRELHRQIESSLYERTMLSNVKPSPFTKQIPQEIIGVFRDSYVLEFLQLPEKHTEANLKSNLIHKLKDFLNEFGNDFLFMGQEFRLSVGIQDFFIDLLFYNRSLNCMVAIELKTTEFHPSHLGQLNFYLEALDRDVRKSHENPSIGILLCKGRNDTVVEYALSRSLSPTLVADYQTKLPDKKLLQEKWEEILAGLEEE